MAYIFTSRVLLLELLPAPSHVHRASDSVKYAINAKYKKIYEISKVHGNTQPDKGWHNRAMQVLLTE